MANRTKLRLGLIRPDRSARSPIFTVEQDVGEKRIEDVDLYVTEEGGTWGAFHASIHPSDASHPSAEVHVKMNSNIVYTGPIDLLKPVVPAISIAIHNDLHIKYVDDFQDVDGRRKPLDHRFLYERDSRPGHFHLLVIVLVDENKVDSFSTTLPLDTRYFLPKDDATYAIWVVEVVVPEDHLGVEVGTDLPESTILAKATWVEPGVSISFDGVERFKLPTICSVLQPISEDELKQIEPPAPESGA